MTLKIAIIGRPNVGKSTLFNRLVGLKLALVDDTPGVTRDRRVHKARLFDLCFNIIDTAGLEEGTDESLQGRMRAQTQQAIEESDLLLFMFDARSGITAGDEVFASIVRQFGKKIILLANKSESGSASIEAYDSWRLGFGDPVKISAEHGLGLADLHEAIITKLGKQKKLKKELKKSKELRGDLTSNSSANTEIEKKSDNLEEDFYAKNLPLKIAIVGRPNVGKSTLINGLLGEERLLTGPESGLTRDSISVDWCWRDRNIKLFDTAGLRRRSRVQEKIEKLSVSDTLRAIRFAEVVVIVFDSTNSFEKQDLHIVDLVIKEGRVPIIAFNKWDLIEDPSILLRQLHEKTERLLPQIKHLRAIPISGERQEGIDRLMENIEQAHMVWNRRITTACLNRWLPQALSRHSPPAVSGRRLKIKYVTQIKTRPPTFVASCTRSEKFPDSYIRYLVNDLSSTFDLFGIPIRFLLKNSENPYVNLGRKKS